MAQFLKVGSRYIPTSQINRIQAQGGQYEPQLVILMLDGTEIRIAGQDARDAIKLLDAMSNPYK